MNKWHPKYAMAGWRVIFAWRKWEKSGLRLISKEHAALDRAIKLAKGLVDERTSN